MHAHMDLDIFTTKGVIVVKNEKYDLQTELVKLEALLLLTAQALSKAGFAELLMHTCSLASNLNLEGTNSI
jgi:hypothetical protein